MEKIFFVEKIVKPTMPISNPSIYLGMGFRGSDGQSSVGFGLDFLLFLFMAKKIGDYLKSKERTIFLMNKPFECDVIDVSSQEILIREIMKLLGMEKEWRIKKFSEFYGGTIDGSSYEEIQSKITANILKEGGYQIGWLYPDYNSPNYRRRDELYFSNKFQEYFPQREDIGFIFGKFPSILPKYTPGPPYLIKQSMMSRRVLLVEKQDELKKKMTAERGLVKLKKSKMTPIFEIFKQIGFSLNGSPPLETFFECMEQLEEAVGNQYRQVFN